MKRVIVIVFLVMDVVISVVALFIAVWVLTHPHDYGKESKTAAFGALGTVLSFWFGSGVGAFLVS
jgi:hypothetical protein